MVRVYFTDLYCEGRVFFLHHFQNTFFEKAKIEKNTTKIFHLLERKDSHFSKLIELYTIEKKFHEKESSKKELLLNDGLNMDKKKLFFSCSSNDYDSVRDILKEKVLLNNYIYLSKDDIRTPLSVCINGCFIKIFDLLIKEPELDINIGKVLKTAIFNYNRFGDDGEHMVNALLDKIDEEPTKFDFESENYLLWASFLELEDVVQRLLDKHLKKIPLCHLEESLKNCRNDSIKKYIQKKISEKSTNEKVKKDEREVKKVAHLLYFDDGIDEVEKTISKEMKEKNDKNNFVFFFFSVKKEIIEQILKCEKMMNENVFLIIVPENIVEYKEYKEKKIFCTLSNGTSLLIEPLFNEEDVHPLTKERYKRYKNYEEIRKKKEEEEQEQEGEEEGEEEKDDENQQEWGSERGKEVEKILNFAKENMTKEELSKMLKSLMDILVEK